MRMDCMRLDPTGSQGAAGLFYLGEGLNVVDTCDETTNHLLADLAGHVLYGARLVCGPRLRHHSSGHHSLGHHSEAGSERTFLEPAGHVDVTSRQGRFRLQRHTTRVDRGDFTEPRLTVTPLDGHAADPQTARHLLGGLSPEVAARLLLLDATDGAQLDWLLSEELATEMRRLERQDSPTSSDDQSSTSLPRTDWHQELFARRDELTRQIETFLADKRHLSGNLEQTLQELQIEEQRLARVIGDQRRELERVVAELSQIESQLRYHELAEYVEQATDKAHRAEQQPALVELDAEIDRWRKAVADLESREAHLRVELTRLHPDDSSPRLSLADQRAAIAIAQRLVRDLDSEVARFARPGDSQACLCQQTHARLHPLVDTLGEQIDKVSRLIEQYEAALELEQLQSEARHLARAQAELRATLDHLLDRRQARLRTSRARTLHDSSSPQPTDAQRATCASLERRQNELTASIDADQRRLAEIELLRQQRHNDRTTLMNDSELIRLRQELESVTRRLADGQPKLASSKRSIAPWRASDILSKLTDGQIREVRLAHGGRAVTVVDRHGVLLTRSQLSKVDCRLVCISLQLASVAAAAQWGVRLPLVLANPFTDLPAPQIAILSLVLHDLAHTGHQIIAFTSCEVALERWCSLGLPILSLKKENEPNHSLDVKPESSSSPTISPPLEDDADSFAIHLNDSIGRFAVFRDETQTLFETIGIHTVSDLLNTEASNISESLDRTGISSAVVELWQTHLVLLSYVPNLSLDDVQLLTGIGVSDLEELAACDAETLYMAICDYLISPQGARHQMAGERFDRKRAIGWIADAQRRLSPWKSTTFSRQWRSRRRYSNLPTFDRSRSSFKQNGDDSSESASKGHNRIARKKKKEKRALRFRLALSSPVVDAPSIGPKTSKRLSKSSIITVADLLAADAEETAEALDMKHIDAETIVAWQHQAQLMCRIPEMLARDTQLLVGCGFSTAEGIAAAEAADLLEFAKSYAATPEGTRALRGGDTPDLDRVTKWIRWAGHRRALEAAS